jgi:PAS domain S-box-containing protein
VCSIGFIAALFAIIPQTPVDGPVGGVVALSSVIVCCWFAGVGPSLLMPLVVWLVSRGLYPQPDQSLIPTGGELMTFFGLSMLTGAVGLAGQTHRRLRDATRVHDERIQEQSRALDLARIVFRNLDGRISAWSAGAQQLYGWTSAEAAGQLSHELLRTGFPIPQSEMRRALLRDGQWQGEVVQHHRDGRQLHVLVHCILYKAGTSVAEVHNDVTELRRAEALIREADRRKDLFVAMLAHELRNPLAPLRTGLDVLRLTYGESAEDAPMLDIMQRQLEHVVRMVDDLLDVSRINTGKVELRRAPVLLSDVVRDASAACRPQIDEAQHNLTISLPDEPLCLYADGARLTQVLMNLLSNAAKFTPSGGRITLTATRDGKDAVVRVRDNGRGIDSESLPRVFEMFSQVDDARHRAPGGLGLGLSIVRNLVELHGGSVEAESAGSGQGAELIVRLPLSEMQSDRPDAAHSDMSATNGSVQPCRVLVVDDNQDAARTLTLLLEKVGFECRSCFDGPSALELAAQFEPHAILLDLGMPQMDGLEVARRLRAPPHACEALLIAVTGWDKEEDRRLSRDAGFDVHLAKPISLSTVQGLLQTAHRRGGSRSERDLHITMQRAGQRDVTAIAAESVGRHHNAVIEPPNCSR